jgi:hypothetical protein
MVNKSGIVCKRIMLNISEQLENVESVYTVQQDFTVINVYLITMVMP